MKKLSVAVSLVTVLACAACAAEGSDLPEEEAPAPTIVVEASKAQPASIRDCGGACTQSQFCVVAGTNALKQNIYACCTWGNNYSRDVMYCN